MVASQINIVNSRFQLLRRRKIKGDNNIINEELYEKVEDLGTWTMFITKQIFEVDDFP